MRAKFSLSFHNLPIANNWGGPFPDLQGLVLYSFSGFCYISGKKLYIVIKKWGLGPFPVLLSASYINQCYHTFHYLFLSCWLKFSHWLFLLLEKLFSSEALFSQQTASIVTIFHLFSFHPHLLQNICIDRWRWDQQGSPGALDMPSLPETAQALYELSPALTPSAAAAGSLFQSRAAQVAGKHLLISWLCLLVTSLYPFVLVPTLPFALIALFPPSYLLSWCIYRQQSCSLHFARLNKPISFSPLS